MAVYKKYITEAEENNIQEKLITFFKNNKNPSDKDVHSFAENEKINKHKFEEIIYKMLGSFFGAGKSITKNITEKDVNKNQLEMGIKVEMEHTNNPMIAKKIVIDHLAEIEDYYTRLYQMEKEAEK